MESAILNEIKQSVNKEDFAMMVTTVLEIGVLQSVQRIGRLDIEAIAKDLYREKQGVIKINEFARIAEEKIVILLEQKLINLNGTLTVEGKRIADEYTQMLERN